jgi:hypothetical protein
MIFFCGSVYFDQQVQKTMFIFFSITISRGTPVDKPWCRDTATCPSLFWNVVKQKEVRITNSVAGSGVILTGSVHCGAYVTHSDKEAKRGIQCSRRTSSRHDLDRQLSVYATAVGRGLFQRLSGPQRKTTKHFCQHSR